ncbi:unnamed protein product, partial [Rotaria sordida]
MLKCLMKNDGRYSSRETTIKLNNSLKNSVCRRTKKERLNWCLAHINRIINDWKRVIFSDEITFYVIKRKNEVKIWRTKDERWKEDCMEVAAVVVGGHVNFSGAITSEGTGCFRIYSENTN